MDTNTTCVEHVVSQLNDLNFNHIHDVAIGIDHVLKYVNISKGAINGATGIVTSIRCNIANEVTSIEMTVTST
jgi:hypothetical protein